MLVWNVKNVKCHKSGGRETDVSDNEGANMRVWFSLSLCGLFIM